MAKNVRSLRMHIALFVLSPIFLALGFLAPQQAAASVAAGQDAAGSSACPIACGQIVPHPPPSAPRRASISAASGGFQSGDVLVGEGNGLIERYSPSGSLLQTMDTGSGSTYETDMCFDAAGDLYTTNFITDTVSKFDNQGNLISGSWGGTFSTPESCYPDASGHIYVGSTGGPLEELDTSGDVVNTFTAVQREDHVAVEGDGCTVLYTDEGSSIHLFNACTSTQESDFATGLPAPCFQLQIRSDGEVLVACSSAVVRLSPSGSVLQTYSASGLGASFLFSLSLDPDGSSFWTADVNAGVVAKVDIASGNVVGSFTAYAPNGLFGLEVAGGTGPAASFTFAPTFGNLFNGIIARLHPTGGPGHIGQETATMAWGDGSVTSAALSSSASDPSELDVSGAHTYWTPGTLPVTITVKDAQAGVSTFHGTATVSSQYPAMGDSYSSGEGADWPPGGSPALAGCDWWLYQDPSGSPQDTDHIDGAYLNVSGGCVRPPFTTFHGNTCHRADTAYSHVVQRLLSDLGMTLSFVACSGDIVQDAFTAAGQVHNDQVHLGEGPQLNTVGPSTSLVTLTFGGNNLDFPGIAKNCVTSTDDYGCLNQDGEIVAGLGYNTKGGTPKDGTFTSSGFVQHPISNLQKTVVSLIGSGGRCVSPGCDLHDALVVLYRAIKAKAPGARILVLGYPHFFPAGGSGGTCEHFSSLDQKWANDRVSLVDAVISDAAAESGVAQYVDTYDALAGHEECSGDPSFTIDPNTYAVTGCTAPGRWINGIDLLAGFFGTPENLHPNPCGHLTEGTIAANAYQSPPLPDPSGIASSDSFYLTPSQKSATTTLSVPPGLTRLNITANWPTGSVALTLTDPSGVSYQPVQQGPAGQLYATWDLNRPTAGTWTLTEADTTTGDTGTITGALTINEASMPQLPPAAQVSVVSNSCGFFTDTATLFASVSHAADARVAEYLWFDDNGKPQPTSGPKGDTIKMSSVQDQYRVIVETIGTNGQHRFTTATFNPPC